MPHAETHTVILPHAVAYNAKGAQNAIKVVSRALGTDNAPQALFDMAKNLGSPTPPGLFPVYAMPSHVSSETFRYIVFGG